MGLTNSFQQDKADKLNRLIALRIMNTLGMIRWVEDSYGGAQQKIRMLHPLSWVWVIASVIIAIILHGIIEVAEELKSVWRNDCVWW
jgi:hypothetical protein